MNRFRVAIQARLYKPGSVVHASIDGMAPLRFALHSKTDRWISGTIRQGYVFEQHIVTLLQAFLRPGDVLLDIGANIGWFTVIGSKCVGAAGRVLSFEPDPFNLSLLRRNLRLNRCTNVDVYPIAVTEKQGRSILYRSTDNQGDHQLAVIADRQEWVSVRTDTIDQVLAGRAGRIAFVKIDTQGSEAAILAGMDATLARNPGARMVLEFWPHGLKRCGSSVEALAAILCGLRRPLWLLHPDGKTEHLDPGRIVTLGHNEYSPLTERHADLIVVPPEDGALTGFLRAREGS